MASKKKTLSRLKKALVVVLALWVLAEIVPVLHNTLTHIIRPLIYLALVAIVAYGVFWFWNKIKE